MKYDVIIIGAGPGGIFTAYELVQQEKHLKIAVFESGHALNMRRCPIDGPVKLCALQHLFDYERIWRRGRFFRRQI